MAPAQASLKSGSHDSKVDKRLWNSSFSHERCNGCLRNQTSNQTDDNRANIQSWPMTVSIFLAAVSLQNDRKVAMMSPRLCILPAGSTILSFLSLTPTDVNKLHRRNRRWHHMASCPGFLWIAVFRSWTKCSRFLEFMSILVSRIEVGGRDQRKSTILRHK